MDPLSRYVTTPGHDEDAGGDTGKHDQDDHTCHDCELHRSRYPPRGPACPQRSSVLLAALLQSLLRLGQVGQARRVAVLVLLGEVEDPAVHRRHEAVVSAGAIGRPRRSEEHTSELQSLMRISYAVFCLKKK